MNVDVPQFETKRAAQEPTAIRGIWKMRVKSVALGGDAELVSAVRCDAAYNGGGGGTEATREYAVVPRSTKAVGDIIIVFVLEGGTHKLYSGKRVHLMEMGGGADLPIGEFQFQGWFMVAQNESDWDDVRFCPP